MPKQRDRVRMTEAEVEAFLDGAKTLVVSTLDRDGAPHLTALWFARQGRQLLFETYGSSQKVVNLRRDQRVAVLCEAGESYDELRGVSIQGEAEIVEGGERLNELMDFIVRRNHPGARSGTAGRAGRGDGGKARGRRRPPASGDQLGSP